MVKLVCQEFRVLVGLLLVVQAQLEDHLLDECLEICKLRVLDYALDGICPCVRDTLGTFSKHRPALVVD